MLPLKSTHIFHELFIKCKTTFVEKKMSGGQNLFIFVGNALEDFGKLLVSDKKML